MFLVFPNPQAIARAVSSMLLTQIRNNPTMTLGLATGSTMEPVYAQLIQQAREDQIDMSQLTSFNLDEYVGLSPEHSQSYCYYMHEQLFNHLNFNEPSLNLPSGLAADLASECARYSQDMISRGGVDLQLLGVGTNGHIGFNEPGTAFDSRTHVVELSEQTRVDNGRFFASLDEVPTHAITMGIQDIMDAKQILLIATGAHKAETLYQYHTQAVNEGMPCTVLKNHPNAIILLDEAAASRLPAQLCNHIEQLPAAM